MCYKQALRHVPTLSSKHTVVLIVPHVIQQTREASYDINEFTDHSNLFDTTSHCFVLI